MRRKGIRRLLAGLVVSAAVAFVSAPTALAHDSVEGTTPADGSTVATVPDKVQLTFNEPPIRIGSEIKITDSSGANWAVGGVDILDKAVTQSLRPGAPAGRYTVQWRVVSADSHPIEGTFSFTAAGGASALTTQEPLISPTAAGTGAPKPAEQPFPWSILAMAVIAGVLVVVLAVTARRRIGSDEHEDDDEFRGPEDRP